MPSRADLHIHSRYSDRSADWLLRRFNFPDSYSAPLDLYRGLRARGMDFVTLTDHNRIEGCLEIADLPGTFISEQVSTVFPEDRCQVHLLVWGISEAQHREIQQARESIYDLQIYLAENQIAHAVAHPLYKLDEKLSAAHVEKLALLFRHFEGINGLRDALLGDVARHILSALTPERIAAFAEKHRLEPTHAEPWRKVFIAGSDDHGGMFPAAAFTEVEKNCATPEEFLAEISAGRCALHGRGGTPLALSHSLYNTLHGFLDEKFFKKNGQTPSFLKKAFSRFMEGRDPTEFSVTEKLGFLADGIASGKIFELAKPANRSLWTQLAATFSHSDFKSRLARETAGIEEPERRAFLMATLLADQLAFRFFTTFVKRLSAGDVIESVQAVSTLTPVLLLLSPYIYSFQSQSPNRRWLRGLSERIAGDVPRVLHNEKRAWLTDTLEDVNGVANTIRRLTAAGVAAGRDLTVVTSRSEIQITDIPIKNFPPVGEFELPEYELQKLSFPPILPMLDYIQREGFTELIISTPGPIGLTGLLAAKMLKLRVSGIYHTDFPQYVRILTDDNFLETLAWNYMHWFYSQMDIVYVNSEHYRQAWAERGIPDERLKILPRGLDTALFHPSRRDPRFRKKHHITDSEVVLLYVGRVSKEKDLDVLAAAYKQLRADGEPVRLMIVGDGPHAAELRQTLPDAIFTGTLTGLELATAYASADLFCFPSTTDTFGNVVLESLASGLPTIVSDTGGPKELIAHNETGLVTRSLDVSDFAKAIRHLVRDPALRASMAEKGRAAVEQRDWSAAFDQFWATTAD